MPDARFRRAPRYACVGCGHVHATWQGRCSGCNKQGGMTVVSNGVPEPTPSGRPPGVDAPEGAPGTLEGPDDGVLLQGDDDEPVPISAVPKKALERYLTGLGPLDHVLGGGLVAASVVLLASTRGVGKTTLSLQVLRGLGLRSMYVTAEETRDQVSMTAHRIGAVSDDLYILAKHDLGGILDKAQKYRMRALVVDSIQRVSCSDVDGRPGTPTQVKECTLRLVRYAKRTRSMIWVIGHVTSDGEVAGPTTIEHDVDVLIELVQGQGKQGRERILRALGKNRFGPAFHEGRFELTDTGLVPVDEDGWDDAEL